MPWESRTRTFRPAHGVTLDPKHVLFVWTYPNTQINGECSAADNGSMLRCYKCYMYGHLQAEWFEYGKVDSELTADRDAVLPWTSIC